jgi:hypothetical protein
MYPSAAWNGTPHIGTAAPEASFERDVLVEHLVEVAHAKKQQGVPVLALGLEVLAHGGREVARDGARRG